MSAKHHKIRVGISIGDFNGIGPEIIIKTLKEKSILDFSLRLYLVPGNYSLTRKMFSKLIRTTT